MDEKTGRTAPASDLDARVEQLRERGIDPEYVSYPCTQGDGPHNACTGRVVQVPGGESTPCRCLDCGHVAP